jgi:hypothetical protein
MTISDLIDRALAWIASHLPLVAAVGWGLAFYLVGFIIGRGMA